MTGKYFIIFALLLLNSVLFACPVHIRVSNLEGRFMGNIAVYVKNISVGTTNAQGLAIIDLNSGKHHIALKSGDFIIKDSVINVNCSDHIGEVKFVIDPAIQRSSSLNEVTISTMTQRQAINVSPFSVQTIDLKTEYSKGGDLGEVLNRATGVKLRSDGNIGAPVQINLGGLQGKAVRLFKDGIPIELFGHGFNLGTIPTNMLERVEIYKGVMPLYLASDALGGGINLVSRNATKDYAELSYELSSFNTHRATANVLWFAPDKEFYAGTNSSFNYSDNSYKVHAPFVDQNTSVTTFRNVPRFHDAVRSVYAEGFLGFKNKSWLDDLRLTLIHSAFYKEIQHDAKMDKVYGQAFSREKNYTAMLNYRKSFLDDRLNVNFLGSYSYFKTKFIDTATVRYDWDGHIIGRNKRPGEINLGNNQALDYRFLSGRFNASYKINEHHTLDFSELYYRQNREGSDPLGAITAIERIDVLTVPAVYQKNNLSLGLRSLFAGKSIESIVALKYYQFNTTGYTTDNFGLGWRSTSKGDQLGYLGGLRWTRGDFMTKLSYEYATRLPDEYEVFGDARLVKENMELKPEKSHNLNLNAQYFHREGNRSLSLSGSLFYRRVKDIIFLQLDIPFNRYINYEEASVKGIELEANYTPSSMIDFGGNITYQDIRRIAVSESAFKNMEGSRVPNVPFLFGNIWLNTHVNNIFTRRDRVDFNWNANYTHRFFLHAIPKNQEPPLFGKVESFQTSLVIPGDGRLGQFANNLGMYYHFANNRISLAGECRNVGNVRLYDNFSVQKPGRSFHLKLVYQLL